MKQTPVCLQYLVFPAVAVVHLLHQAYPCIALRSSDRLYDVEAVDDDPGIWEQCLNELDVLGIQTKNMKKYFAAAPIQKQNKITSPLKFVIMEERKLRRFSP